VKWTSCGLYPCAATDASNIFMLLHLFSFCYRTWTLMDTDIFLLLADGHHNDAVSSLLHVDASLWRRLVPYLPSIFTLYIIRTLFYICICPLTVISLQSFWPLIAKEREGVWCPWGSPLYVLFSSALIFISLTCLIYVTCILKSYPIVAPGLRRTSPVDAAVQLGSGDNHEQLTFPNAVRCADRYFIASGARQRGNHLQLHAAVEANLPASNLQRLAGCSPA
jgi:hypothetical protein